MGKFPGTSGFCTNCGMTVNDKGKFCANCGTMNATANQPRHGDSGQYLRHGSGSGRGPVHKSATGGYKDSFEDASEELHEDDAAAELVGPESDVEGDTGTDVVEVVPVPKSTVVEADEADDHWEDDAPGRTNGVSKKPLVPPDASRSTSSQSFTGNANPEGHNQYTKKDFGTLYEASIHPKLSHDDLEKGVAHVGKNLSPADVKSAAQGLGLRGTGSKAAVLADITRMIGTRKSSLERATFGTPEEIAKDEENISQRPKVAASIGRAREIVSAAKPVTGNAKVLATYNRDWPASKREALKKSSPEDFAGPHGSFPIRTQADVDSASKLVGHANDPAGVKSKIKAIAKRKGLDLPESWEEGTENANTEGHNQYSGEGGRDKLHELAGKIGLKGSAKIVSDIAGDELKRHGNDFDKAIRSTSSAKVADVHKHNWDNAAKLLMAARDGEGGGATSSSNGAAKASQKAFEASKAGKRGGKFKTPALTAKNLSQMASESAAAGDHRKATERHDEAAGLHKQAAALHESGKERNLHLAAAKANEDAADHHRVAEDYKEEHGKTLNVANFCPKDGTELEDGECPECGWVPNDGVENSKVRNTANLKVPGKFCPDCGAPMVEGCCPKCDADEKKHPVENAEMKREQLISSLAFNCRCEEDTLNELDDSTLAAMERVSRVANTAGQGFTDGQGTAYRVNPETGRWEKRELTANANVEGDYKTNPGIGKPPTDNDDDIGDGDAGEDEGAEPIGGEDVTGNAVDGEDDPVADARETIADSRAADNSKKSQSAMRCTGDAEEQDTKKAHREAASAHSNAADYHDSRGNGELADAHRTMAKSHFGLATDLPKVGQAAGTTDNLKVERNRKERTNNMRTKEIDALIANGIVAASDRDQTIAVLNAFKKKKKGEEMDDDEENAEDGGDDEDMENNLGEAHSFDTATGSKGKSEQAGGAGTKDEYPTKNVREWYAKAPPEARRLLAKAAEHEKQQRIQLTANLKAIAESTVSLRKKNLILNALKKNPDVDRLEELVALTSEAPAFNRVEDALPNYLGAASPTYNTAEEDTEIIVMPVLNWAEIAKERATNKAAQ